MRRKEVIMVTNVQVEKIVGDILKQRLAVLGYRGSDVASDIDFDGAPIIRVTAHFDKPVDKFDELFASASAIRDVLIQSGDDRYVFLTHDYPGAQAERDDDEDDDILAGNARQ